MVRIRIRVSCRFHVTCLRIRYFTNNLRASLFTRIKHERYWAVVDQRYLHAFGEAPFLDLQRCHLAKFLNPIGVEGARGVPGHAVAEAGARAFAEIAVERELRDDQQRAADVGGALLIVSQFTLYGDLRKGTRPSFSDSMPGDAARTFYTDWVQKLRQMTTLKIEEGRFAESMQVSLINDGPVTLMLDSRK